MALRPHLTMGLPLSLKIRCASCDARPNYTGIETAQHKGFRGDCWHTANLSARRLLGDKAVTGPAYGQNEAGMMAVHF